MRQLIKDDIKKNNNAVLLVITFILFYLGCVVSIYVLLKYRIVKWPFRWVSSELMAYNTILEYTPLLIIPLLSLLWLKKSNINVLAFFKYSKTSSLTLLGIIVSVAVSIYLLLFTGIKLRDLVYWPPVIVLSLLNAFTEEMVYRFTLYSLLKKIIKHSSLVNLIQSLFYALPHYYLGGIFLVIGAFMYGVLLGFIFEKEKSIIPCIICHFLIDIGCIGFAILNSHFFI